MQNVLKSGFLMTDALVACVISVCMLSAIIGMVVSLKTRMHIMSKKAYLRDSTLLKIETPIVRLDSFYCSKGLSDEFSKKMACVCYKQQDQKVSHVSFRSK